MLVAVLPALSTAVTTNCFAPIVAVSIAAPGATVPTQLAMPLPPGLSVHVYAAFTVLPES